MMTTTGTSGRDATLSANLGEHQRHVPRAVAMQIAPIVVPASESRSRRGVLLSERPELCPRGRVVDLGERRGRVDRRAARTGLCCGE